MLQKLWIKVAYLFVEVAVQLLQWHIIQYHDMSHSGSESSIHRLPLQQPVVTTSGFSQVGTSALTTVDLSSLTASLPAMTFLSGR